MRIFITGIAGFIGFHLARILRDRGDVVCGVDNFNSYYEPKLKFDRAAELKKKGIVVYKGEIRDLPTLEKWVMQHETTHFVHLAAQAGVRLGNSSPDAYIQSNLEGFIRVLELLKNYPTIPLIYASSSSVYGANKKTPFSETDPTDHPIQLYGATKKSNEVMAYAYHHLYGLAVTGLRFFTVYGPWGRPDMAYFSFTRRILEREPISLYYRGEMLRDFTYIDDLIEGIVAAIELCAPCEIFNLGRGQPESVGYLLSLLEEKIGKTGVVKLLSETSGEALITYADLAKSREKLRFFPQTTLDQGIERFLHWYYQYRSL